MSAQKAKVRRAGEKYLVWNVEHIVWLRSSCRLAVTPIGACPTKVSTRGKAAAVPVLLSDEDLYTAVANEWVDIVDEQGTALAGEAALQSSLQSFPASGQERQMLRRLVHCDLTNKGYALTNGLKFGVDFLAYRGDPTAVHAAFMVIVARQGAGISPLDLVARSRVATTALKIAVMAWASPATGGVAYKAFKRMGPGAAIFTDRAAQEAGMQAAAAAAAGAGDAWEGGFAGAGAGYPSEGAALPWAGTGQTTPAASHSGGDNTDMHNSGAEDANGGSGPVLTGSADADMHR